MEIKFYGDKLAEPINMISNRILDDIPPQMKILNNGYPNSNALLEFSLK